MADFYYAFWFIFIIILLLFLTGKYVIIFFKTNKIKSLLTILFKKENKIIIIILIIFTIIFWFSFYKIYYIKIFPSLKITETNETNSTHINTTNYIISDGIKQINLNDELILEITDISREYIVFKLNNSMYLKECENCNLNILNQNTEYKLSLNNRVFLINIDSNFQEQIYYTINLYN